MNLPNKLTVSRLALTVFFLLALFIDFPFHFTVALVFFVAASLTDLFDDGKYEALPQSMVSPPAAAT